MATNSDEYRKYYNEFVDSGSFDRAVEEYRDLGYSKSEAIAKVNQFIVDSFETKNK